MVFLEVVVLTGLWDRTYRSFFPGDGEVTIFKTLVDYFGQRKDEF